MFDIGIWEMLLVAAVAIAVIGPKQMPQALRDAGRWVGKMRRISNQFRAGFEAMVREAELEEMEKEWKERNARIMREHDGAALPSPEGAGSDADTAGAARDDDQPAMEPLNPPATPQPGPAPDPAPGPRGDDAPPEGRG